MNLRIVSPASKKGISAIDGLEPHASLLNFLLQICLFPKRLSFRWRNRNRQKISEAAIAAVRALLKEARNCGSKNLDAVHNVGLYILLLERDLSAYNALLFLSKSTWHQQFAARGMAVLLYEGCEDILKLLGKAYRICLTDLGLGQLWFQELNRITSGFNSFKQMHFQFLKGVRNYVGAHREKDALVQIEFLDGLNPVEVYRLGAAFSAPLNDFVNFQIKLTRYAKHPGVMLQEAIKLAEKPNSSS